MVNRLPIWHGILIATLFYTTASIAAAVPDHPIIALPQTQSAQTAPPPITFWQEIKNWFTRKYYKEHLLKWGPTFKRPIRPALQENLIIHESEIDIAANSSRLHDIDIHYAPNDHELEFLNNVDELVQKNDYKEARFKFISHFEGSTERAIDVGDGRRTIGYGLDMSTQYARETWKKIFRHDTIRNHFDEYYSGRKKLTREQERVIFEYVADQFSQELDELGLTKNVLTPHQRIAVESMYYNGSRDLIYPTLTNYIIKQDHQAAFNQILTKSDLLFQDGKPIPLAHGLANRRLIEATLYAGPTNFDRVIMPPEHVKELFNWLSACLVQGVNPDGDHSDHNYLFNLNVHGNDNLYQVADINPQVAKRNISHLKGNLKIINNRISEQASITPPVEFEI